MTDEETYGVICDEAATVRCRCGHVQGFHVDATSANGRASYCVELACRCERFEVEPTAQERAA